MMKKYRIEGLSDLVFGLALSIGSLAMISQPVIDSVDVMEGILWFVFGFLIIVSVWVSYTKIISDTEVESKLDFRLNLGLLMLVAIEPYLLYLLGKPDDGILDFASTAYAIDIGLIMLILAGFYHRRNVETTSDETRELDRRERNVKIVVASIFLVSTLPIFWDTSVFGTNLRFVIWMMAIIPGTIMRLNVRRSRAGNLGS